MQVILQTHVAKLGQVGDVVDVKPGYFRNHLQPKGMAVMSTPAALEAMAARRAELEAQEQERMTAAQALSDKLEGVALSMAVRTVSAGRMFGSIKANDLQRALQEQGIEVEKKVFVMPKGDIHQLGQYAIEMRLHPSVVAHIDLEVTAQEDA